jgi:hypothetical protein
MIEHDHQFAQALHIVHHVTTHHLYATKKSTMVRVVQKGKLGGQTK